MLQTTPARVAAPIAPACDEELPDEDLAWVPGDLPRAVRSRRTYRIPVILLAAAAAVGLYAGAGLILQLPVAYAEDARASYRSALTATLEVVPEFREAAAGLVSGTVGPPAAGETALVRMEGLAADLRGIAERPDPLIVPGLLSEDLERLDPIRDRIGSISERITAIGTLASDAALYRSTMDEMFVFPDLPGPEEGPSVEVVSDRLSEMTAATVEAAALLPDSEVFADHRAGVADLVAWLPDWHGLYVEALRDDDLQGAAGLRAEAEARSSALRDALDGMLTDAAVWIDRAITDLTFEIQAALILTG
jgi:hypothetical protein